MEGRVFSKKCIKLGPGTKVELKDLQSKPELNGTIVTCLKFDSEKMRWGVELPSGSTISVKMKNIKPLQQELAQAQSEIVTVPLVEELNRPRDYQKTNKIEEVKDVWEESEETIAESEDQEASQESSVVTPGEAPAEEASAPAEEVSVPAEEAPVPAEEAPVPAEKAAVESPDSDSGGPDIDNEEEFPALDPSCLPATPPCLWSQDSKAEDWAKALRMNEPKFTSLLVVPNRQFSDEDQEVLFNALQTNTVLEDLCIAPCHALGPRGVAALVEALAANQTLRKLQLGGKSFTDEVALAISAGIAKNTSLKVLDFGRSKLTDKSFCAVIDALNGRVMDELLFQELKVAKLPVLNALKVDLTGCRLKDNSVPALRQLLKGGCTDLNLMNNRFSQDGLLELLQVLDRTSALTHLNLNENAIGDDGMAGIIGALEAGWRVDTLSISACDLQETEALDLSQAIMLHGQIRALNMRDNNLSTEVIESFARRAPAELDVANNKAETTKVLLAFRDTDIEKLILQANQGANIAEMTGDLGLRKLTELDLANNQIPSSGVLALIDRLTKDKNALPALEVCVVGGNVTDPNVLAEPAQELCEARNGKARFIFEVK